jgi:hypothetical protein
VDQLAAPQGARCHRALPYGWPKQIEGQTVDFTWLPSLIVLRFDDDAHSVVILRHPLVGLDSDNGKRFEDFTRFFVLPAVPPASECELAVVLEAESTSLFLAVDHGPFIEPIRGHQATAMLERLRYAKGLAERD